MSVNELLKEVQGLGEKVLPYTLYRYLIFTWKKVKLCGKKWPYQEELFLKYRPFSKKAYCIIRIGSSKFSLFAAAKRYIFAAEYVRSKGMYPIMDFEWESDFEKRTFGEENIWDGVFQQKTKRNILSENATIIVSGLNEGINWGTKETCMDINDDPADMNIHVREENWRSYYKNLHKYIRRNLKFNQSILRAVNIKGIELFQGEERVMGIAMREMFSQEFFDQIRSLDARKVLKWHPAGPSVAETLDIVAVCMEEWRCTKIFLGTVYSETIERFEERFPGRIIYLQRDRDSMLANINAINSRKHFFDKTQEENRSDTDRENQKKGFREYVMETLLLSKCDYFIGAVSAQSAMALSINGGRYKDIKVLEDRNHIERY